MKNTLKRLAKPVIMLLASHVCAIAVSAASPLDRFNVIPQPRQSESVDGPSLSPDELRYVITDGVMPYPVMPAQLDALPRHKTKGKGVTLHISDSELIPESAEGYTLLISRNGADISARGEAGLFYGLQTLAQLMTDSRELGIAIPAMKITDWPAIDYRAVHWDNKHHLDRAEYYYRQIDRLASYKINAVIWEIDDKLHYESHPEIGSPNALSKQEVLAISRYARDRQIAISPLVQGLGHASYILKHHWELRENPASDWEFCPSNPLTYEFLFDLYRDALEAMPFGRYLHVGGDEITAIGIDQRCRQTGKTPFELQMEWLGKVCGFATDRGLEPIFWDDMPLKFGNIWPLIIGVHDDQEIIEKWNTDKLDSAIDLFPPQCIYMRWNYGDPTTLAHRRLLEWYGSKGLKVMGATAASLGDTPFMPRNDSRAQYIKEFSRLVADNHLEGILATNWDDGAPHPETVARGLIAQGEFGWNPDGRSVDQFLRAHARREFSLGYDDMAFLPELENSAFFFDDALIVSGRRRPAWGVKEYTLMELPDPARPGAWSEKYADKIAAAKEQLIRHDLIAEGIDRALAKSRRNRYTLMIYRSNNELFTYPARLICAMAGYDASPSDSTRQALINECSSFGAMRDEIERTYSTTRFMTNPAGYIADMNHHSHLSALTDNSDWLFLYELPMTHKIMESLNCGK